MAENEPPEKRSERKLSDDWLAADGLGKAKMVGGGVAGGAVGTFLGVNLGAVVGTAALAVPVAGWVLGPAILLASTAAGAASGVTLGAKNPAKGFLTLAGVLAGRRYMGDGSNGGGGNT